MKRVLPLKYNPGALGKVRGGRSQRVKAHSKKPGGFPPPGAAALSEDVVSSSEDVVSPAAGVVSPAAGVVSLNEALEQVASRIFQSIVYENFGEATLKEKVSSLIVILEFWQNRARSGRQIALPFFSRETLFDEQALLLEPGEGEAASPTAAPAA